MEIGDIIIHYRNEAGEMFKREPWKTWMANNLAIRRYLGRDSIALYAYQLDEVINTGIRRGRLSELGYAITGRIIDLISKAQPIPEDLFLFRGVKETNNFKVTHLKIGDHYYDPGFVSKSIDPNQVNTFSDERCCGMIIGYKRGSVPMIYLQNETNTDEISASPFDEYEMLTYPGEIFTVQKISPMEFYGEKILTTYYLEPMGFQYATLPDDLLSIVDLSIDRDFKTLFNGIVEAYKIYECVGITFDNESVAIIPPNYNLINHLKGYLKMFDYLTYFYTLYSRFCNNRIQKIIGINGLANLQPENGFTFTYLKNGARIAKRVTGDDYLGYKFYATPYDNDDNEFEIPEGINDINIFFNAIIQGNLQQTNLPGRITMTVLPLTYKISEKPDYYTKGKHSEIITQENLYRSYQQDVRFTLSVLYGRDPVIHNFIGLPVDQDVSNAEQYVLLLNTYPVDIVAQSMGIILLPNTNPEEYYLNNIVAYLKRNINQVKELTEDNYYYPSDNWNAVKSAKDVKDPIWFVPYKCGDIQNVTLEKGSIKFLQSPILAYGTPASFHCYDIKDLNTIAYTNFDINGLEDIVRHMNLKGDLYNRLTIGLTRLR